MRDGVHLTADVYRPAQTGSFPALLSMHSYCKDIERTSWLGKVIRRMSPDFSGVEAGDHEFWVKNGYVHVIADVRGSAKSEGSNHGLHSPQEAQDGYDLVEWIASQPWCDGNVGMSGISYLGIIQYFVAAKRPPHLKAIFPHDAWGDLYRDIMYHGGIPSVFRWTIDRLPTISGVSRSYELYDAAELRSRVAQLLDDESTSLAKCPQAIRSLMLPQIHPVAFDTLVNPVDGPFWRERSAVEVMGDITIPVHLGSELHAYTTAMHLPGVSWGWEHIKSPKKLTLRPSYTGGLDRPLHQLNDDMLRWYDYWLRGVENGVMDEPPVKIWVRGRDNWRYADEWPLLSDTDWTRVYLRADGRLTVREAPTATEASARMDYEPAQPVVVGGPLSAMPEFLSYATDPFEAELELIGPMVLRLRCALNERDGDFFVVIKDVDPKGTEFVLTRGWLRASHRAIDSTRSTPWRPFHPHTNPEPVEPGKPTNFLIEIRPLANVFGAGHRLKLEIWPWDYPAEPYYDWTLYWGKGHHIPFGLPVRYDVHHDAAEPSYLLVPVIRAST